MSCLFFLCVLVVPVLCSLFLCFMVVCVCACVFAVVCLVDSFLVLFVWFIVFFLCFWFSSFAVHVLVFCTLLCFLCMGLFGEHHDRMVTKEIRWTRAEEELYVCVFVVVVCVRMFSFVFFLGATFL